MRKMSDKTKKFLAALNSEPDASINSLAKRHKIATGYAYKLAKKKNNQAIEKVLGPRPAHLQQPKPATGREIAELLGLPVNAVQVGGDHYRKNPIQPWDYIVSNELGYLEGNIVKYVSRWKDKGGRQDLEKARHYLDKLLEVA